VAAAYVLLTAVAGPLAAKYADRLPRPRPRVPVRMSSDDGALS
jgi:hypothetical protein